MKNPYLTFVVAGRNDNYGEEFLERFQIFLNNQFFLWEKCGLRAELIIVEWNPPADRPRLKDALQWPAKLKGGTVRIVEVPKKFHDRLPHPPKQEFFEYYAKNVGTRRAQGQFVVCTNNDLLYSEALIRFFASESLKKDLFYRVHRYDIPKGILPFDADSEEQLQFCASHVKYIHNNYGPAFVTGEKPWGFRSLKRVLIYTKNRLRYFPYPPPYMNAAGDFFLMHKEWWDYFGGYPEVNHNAYPDVLCFMSLAAGLRQATLEPPMLIYHQDHERGGPESGRPKSDFEKNKAVYMQMLKDKKPWLPNGKNWGLGDETLPETQVL